MTRIIPFLAFLLLGLMPAVLPAQQPRPLTASELHQAIEKLNFLGSALYVAAHPDDENQRVIAYLANYKKANTAYLSLTRGDGGQNLVGPEIRELLGVIRTQELLAARRTDGGNQLFTRANDFGYSKHPDETLRIWNDDEVLADVVWAIRRWRPDIIINRFDHRRAGQTHGHHTSSALLSIEAFNLTADAGAFPEQLEYVEPWQPARLYYNTSWWRYGSQEEFDKLDKSNMAMVDVGVYYPSRGRSNNEIATAARSNHRSQGFGSLLSRGEEKEYLELVKGEIPADKDDLFAGINTTWTRVKGGAPIGKLLAEVAADYDFEKPYASVPGLLEAYRLIEALPDGYWKRVKGKEIREVIAGCMGLYLEVVAEEFSATPGQTIELTLDALNRSPVEARLQSVTFLPMAVDHDLDVALAGNQDLSVEKSLLLPVDMPFTNPYWLNEPASLGMYTVPDQRLRGLPETPRAFQVRFNLQIEGVPVQIDREVVFKRRDPVEGEVYRPFEITPPVFVGLTGKVYLFADEQPQAVEVTVRAGRPDVEGTLALDLPQGWRTEPASVPVTLSRKDEVQTVSFTLFPPAGQSVGEIHPAFTLDGQKYHRELHVLEYDHIPTQTVLLDATARVARIDLKKAGERVGYIMGAGDEVPESLERVGYEVEILSENDMTAGRLQEFDAIVLGIRAYNTIGWLKFHQAALMDYVRQGGTMVVQYTKAPRFDSALVLPLEEMAPYPMLVTNDRVTVEEAEMRFLAPDHPVVNWPNQITAKDFEGWVQERGLYFAGEWDKENYTAIFSCNDPGEDPQEGSLLVADYGDGHYIYTGLSFFRELPAGVPGAFRLFANLISLGKKEGR